MTTTKTFNLSGVATSPPRTGESPLVTVFVCCYNHSRFVEECLDSVRQQTYQNIQVMVLDDCSTDNSVAVIEAWLAKHQLGWHFVRHAKNKGFCASLNELLRLAGGKYISMIATDDLWLPEKIATQVALMESQPEMAGVLYSDAFQIDEGGQALPEMFIAGHRQLTNIPQGKLLDVLLEGNFIPAMTTLIRRQCYETVGYYDETLWVEDWDMWLRIAAHYAFVFSPSPSAIYRYSATSASHANRNRTLKASFATCLKQAQSKHLTSPQRNKVLQTMSAYVEALYASGDPERCKTLYEFWQASGQWKDGWRYCFARLGLSYRVWTKANSGLERMRRVRQRLSKSRGFEK